jgi:glycosyltransferase involved in cell wall biosynthesis
VTERPLKILMTDPHLAGGGQVRYVASLARELSRMGHQVTIGCKPGSVLVSKAAGAGCPVADCFGLRGGLRPRVWLGDLAAMSRFIREERPDLLHANGSQDHWVAAIANRMAGSPCRVVRTRHNTYAVSNNPANRWLNRAATDHQIAVCEMVRRQLAAQPAFDGERMAAIHNGVDTDRFRPDPAAREEARSLFGFTPGEVVVGIVARLVPAKGHELLFKAFPAVRAACPAARLLVLGQGRLEAELRALAAELGIANATVFAGFREDMERCVHAVDIGAQPSVDCDTSSFSMKEMMAAGIPVVASDYGGLPEIIDDGAEGCLVPAGTVAPLGDRVAALAADPDMRAAMGARGRERVLREFSLETMARRTVAVYRAALGRGDGA